MPTSARKDFAPKTAIWQTIIEELKSSVESRLIEVWIQPLEAEMADPSTLLLYAPDQFFAEFVQMHFQERIKEAIERMGLSLKVKIKSKSENELEQIFEEKVKKSGLLRNLTFENFMKSSSNEYALKWSKFVASYPGRINPLFIVGGTGLGKTHLLNAIGIQALKADTNRRILYLTAGRFVDMVARAVQKRQISKLREFLGNIDILLFDDFHDLKRKPFMIREFLNILKSMIPAGKQVVIASRYSLQSMRWLDTSIKSRIQSGVVAYINRADFELRYKIIANYADEFGITLPEDEIEFLARNLKGDNRKIRGAIARIAAFQSLSDNPLSTKDIRHVLSDMLQEPELFVDDVFKSVSKSFRIPVSEIKGKTRRPSAVAARQAVTLILRDTLKLSLKEIGQHINRSHSTVIYTIKNARKRLKSDKTFKSMFTHAVNSLMN